MTLQKFLGSTVVFSINSLSLPRIFANFSELYVCESPCICKKVPPPAGSLAAGSRLCAVEPLRPTALPFHTFASHVNVFRPDCRKGSWVVGELAVMTPNEQVDYKLFVIDLDRYK